MNLSLHDGNLEITCYHCNNSIPKGAIIFQLGKETYDSPYCSGQGILIEAIGLRGEMEDVLEAGDKFVAVDDSVTILDSDFELWDKITPIMIVLREDRYPYSAGEVIKAITIDQVNDTIIIKTFSEDKVTIERSMIDIYF